MQTIYSDDQRLHFPKYEVLDGELVTPFESPQRMDMVLNAIRASQLGTVVEPEAFPDQVITAVHSLDYVQYLQTAWAEWSALGRKNDILPYVHNIRGMRTFPPRFIDAKVGYYAMDGAAQITSGTWQAVRSAVNVAMTAQKHVSAGARGAFALCRPPGHHAVRAGGMGYCLLSNLGVAIAVAKRENPGIRIAVVDWDVHHGNGTQDIFWDDVDVLTISLHQDRLYPRTSGMREEMGVDGSNVNIPLPAGTGNGGYLYAFDQVVIPALMRFKPDLIAVASGFDSSVYDPLGRMMVTASGYAKMTAKLQEVADVYSKGRIVIAHEGGYNAVYSPFCGLFVLQQLSGIKKLDDPFIHTENYPGQDLYPHQAEVIDLAAAQHGLRRG